MDRQTFFGKHAVMQETIEIEGLGAVAGHVGVAEHEIHVVYRVESAKKTSQKTQPFRAFVDIGLLWTGNEECDVLGIESFIGIQLAVRIAADAGNQISETAADNLAADYFVREAVILEEMFVEKVTKGAVAHVV